MCMRKVNPTWWPNVTITIVRQNPVRPKSTTSNQRKTIEKSQVGIFLPPSPSRTLHVSPISCNNCYFRFYFLFFFIIINTSSQRTTPPCTRTHHIIYLHHVFDVCSFYNSCVSSCCILYRIFCTTKSNVFAHRKLDRIAHCKSDAKKTTRSISHTKFYWPFDPNWQIDCFDFECKMDRRVRICIWKPLEEDVVQVNLCISIVSNLHPVICGYGNFLLLILKF